MPTARASCRRSEIGQQTSACCRLAQSLTDRSSRWRQRPLELASVVGGLAASVVPAPVESLQCQSIRSRTTPVRCRRRRHCSRRCSGSCSTPDRPRRLRPGPRPVRRRWPGWTRWTVRFRWCSLIWTSRAGREPRGRAFGQAHIDVGGARGARVGEHPRERQPLRMRARRRRRSKPANRRAAPPSAPAARSTRA